MTLRTHKNYFSREMERGNCFVYMNLFRTVFKEDIFVQKLKVIEVVENSQFDNLSQNGQFFIPLIVSNV